MEKEKKKNSNGKILSEIQDRLMVLEYMAFVGSIKRFEQTNGREPTWDEKRNMAKNLDINLSEYEDEFLDNFSSNGFRTATR